MKTRLVALFLALTLTACGGGGGGGGGSTASAATVGSAVAAMSLEPQGELRLLADPAPLDADGDGAPDVAPDEVQLVVDALDASGRPRDVTELADVSVDRPEIVAVLDGGRLVAVAPGEATLVVRLDTGGGPPLEERRRVIVEAGALPAGDPAQLEVYPATRTLRAATAADPVHQQLRVTGVLSDGVRRDVTRRVALVVREGTDVAPLALVGPGAVFVARAEGAFDLVTDLVDPALSRLQVGAGTAPIFTGTAPITTSTTPAGDPLARFKASTNPIDVAALKGFERLKVAPAAGLDAEGFVRRATIDLLGRAPTEAERTAYLADPRPAALVDKLLGEAEYASHWGVDVLAPMAGLPPVMTDNGKSYDVGKELTDAVAADQPLSQLVMRLSTGTDPLGQGFDALNRRAEDRVEALTGAFAGATVECARCHDHRLTMPKDDPKWTQRQAYGLYAFFTERASGITLKDASGTSSVVAPAFVLDGVKGAPSSPAVTAPLAQRREAFGRLFGRSDAFILSTAHRVWTEVGPQLLDGGDVRESTLMTVVTPELLAALGKSFETGGTKLRPLLRAILGSELYRTSSAGAADARRDAAAGRAIVRRNRAEVVAHGLAALAGRPPTPWMRDRAFLQSFGAPDARRDRPRRDDVNLYQAALLLNSPKGVQRDLSAIATLAADVDAGKRTRRDAIQTLFRRALSRDPSATELSGVEAALAAVPTKVALEDLAVALGASSELALRQ
jgi:hypothetical protein